jgi:hypothetical protein
MTAPESTNDDGEKLADEAGSGDGVLGDDTATVDGPGPGEEVPSDATSSAAPAGDPPPGSSGGALEWLFARNALREARSAVQERDPERSRRLVQARKAIAYGDLILDPASPPQQGAGPEFALSLYRDALAWLLAVRTPDLPVTPASTDLPLVELSALSGDLATPDELAAIASWNVEGQSLLDQDATFERARRTKRILHALADRLDAEERTVARLKLRRNARVFTVFTAFAVVLAGIVFLVTIASRKPNLAKNKPWRASSSAGVCHPEKRQCTGTDTGIFFHTKEEDSPWVELDLGKPTPFTRTEIVNRLDCCSDRALPLVVEVSNDARTWKEVAKRTESFRTWNANVGQQNARYVRARVARKSVLHLEGFSVR